MRRTLPIGLKFSQLGIGGDGGGFIFKLIFVPSDFPTVTEADAGTNIVYVGGTDPSVIDNDPTKTNTGQTILYNKRYVWDSASASYYEIGGDDIWTDDGVDVKTASPRNVNLQDKGLKDVNVTTVLKIGDALNPTLNTVNQTIIGAINELASRGSTPINLTTQLDTGGVTEFTLPFELAHPEISSVYWNGNRQLYGINYTIDGAILTWINTAPSFPLADNDGINSLYIIPETNLIPRIINTPSLIQYVSAPEIGVVGDSMVFYDIKFATENQKEFIDYNPATGVATILENGDYDTAVVLLLNGLTTAHTNGNLVFDVSGTPNYIWRGNPANMMSPAGDWYSTHKKTLKLNAGQTVKTALQVYGGAKSIDVVIPSQFSINLLRRNT